MAAPGDTPSNAFTPSNENSARCEIDLTPFNPFPRVGATASPERYIPADSPQVLAPVNLAAAVDNYYQHGDSNSYYKFQSGVAALPHPEKKGEGEDAYFISECGFGLGVADGVGGWSEHGVDAGEYSRELMQHAKDYVESTLSRDPHETLDRAYEAVRSQGSTTACIVSLDGKTIRVSNIGDSGLLLFRYVQCDTEDNENNSRLSNTDNQTSGYWGLAFKTKDQQHYFNCPRQLGTNSSDYPFNADEYEIQCLPGDIVVVVTDGVTDNLSVQDLCQILNSMNAKAETDMEKLAHTIASESSVAATDNRRSTPFAENARANGLNYNGGKLDDITVIAALIYEEEELIRPSRLTWSTPQMNRYGVMHNTPDTRFSSPSDDSELSEDVWLS